MKSTETFFASQYELIRQSRTVLFGFCRTLTHADLIRENELFGRGGSVRNLLVHIANTYEFWIVKNALKRNIHFTEYESKETIDEIKTLFTRVDREVADFITAYASSVSEAIPTEIDGIKKSIPASVLFTHVITHEFHHKGQIVSLCRHMGYAPVDTDIIW